MAPLKTKRLSSFDKQPVKAKVGHSRPQITSPVLKARRSSRMAIKRVFSTAKNKPKTSLSHPVDVDSSGTSDGPQPNNHPCTPQKQTHPVPADPQPDNNNSPPSVGCDEATPLRTRVRTFHGTRPTITKKRKFNSTHPVEQPSTTACSSPARVNVPVHLRNQTPPRSHYTQPENHSHPLPAPMQSDHPVPSPLQISPRRAAPRQSNHPVPSPLRTSPRRTAPQRSNHPLPRPADSQRSSHPLQSGSTQLSRGPPPPSIREFSRHQPATNEHHQPATNEQLQPAVYQESAEQVQEKHKSIRVKNGDDIGMTNLNCMF